jgi:hypothetical protein
MRSNVQLGLEEPWVPMPLGRQLETKILIALVISFFKLPALQITWEVQTSEEMYLQIMSTGELAAILTFRFRDVYQNVVLHDKYKSQRTGQQMAQLHGIYDDGGKNYL